MRLATGGLHAPPEPPAIGPRVDRWDEVRPILLRLPPPPFPRVEVAISHDFRLEVAVYNANLIESIACAGRCIVIRGMKIVGPYGEIEQTWAAGRAWHGSSLHLLQQDEAEASALRVAQMRRSLR